MANMEDMKMVEEISTTLNEIYMDGDEELRELSQEQRDVELLLTRTFPEAIDALEAFKQDPSEKKRQALESNIDLLRTQYFRIDQLGLTAEHLVATLAKLIDRLDSCLTRIKESDTERLEANKQVKEPDIVFHHL